VIEDKKESNYNDIKLLIKRIEILNIPYTDIVQDLENDPIYIRRNIRDAEDLDKINKSIDNVMSYGSKFMHSNPPPIIAVGGGRRNPKTTRYIYVRDDVKNYRKSKPRKSNTKRSKKGCDCK
jgi:hypothetical protein